MKADEVKFVGVRENTERCGWCFVQRLVASLCQMLYSVEMVGQ